MTSYPSWIYENAQAIDPLNNPYFGTGSDSLGNSNGWGVYDFSQLPQGYGGTESFINPGLQAGDSSFDPSINPQALSDWLKSNGLTMQRAQQGDTYYTYLQDANGNMVGEPQVGNGNDDTFWTAAMLASALVGGSVASWAGAGGAGAGTAGAADAAAAGTAGGAAAGGAGTTAATAGSGFTAAGTGLGGTGAGLSVGTGATLGGTTAATAGSSLIGGISNGQLMNAGLQIGLALYGQSQNNKAAQQAIAGQQNALDLQRYMYDTTRADYAPWRQAGAGAVGQMQNLLANPSSITSDPGYQFGLSQGTKALNNGAAAGGMTYSGAQQKALTKYGQDYGQTKLNESYNRLASMAGLGQTATSGTAAAGTSYAANGGNLLSSMGNTQGASTYGNGQTWLNAVNNIANYGQQQNLLGGWKP